MQLEPTRRYTEKAIAALLRNYTLPQLEELYKRSIEEHQTLVWKATDSSADSPLRGFAEHFPQYLGSVIREAIKRSKKPQTETLVILITLGFSSLLLTYIGFFSNTATGKIVSATGYNMSLLIGLLGIISISFIFLLRKSK